ncbi:hypothetical protein [Actinomadura pelletieri]|uniref:hypothetical protein n=1 Tax=Actinomadura pelletieri TaxID=111805 RepID=UPI001B884968|nr:hypothetical protein [Actinomadura pelletieri]
MFEIGGVLASPVPDALLRDTDLLDTVPARSTVPVLAPLRPVLPGGGLRPGSVVGLDGLGAASLGLALVAGVAGDDRWCGVVGLPGFGVVAAVGMGAAPDRLLLVDDPGDRWPDVVAALAEAVDLILLCPPERPGAAAVRRLTALARKHGCVLTLTGAFARDWPGTRLRLRVEDVVWEGVADGHGRLTGRRVRVVAEGRDAPGRGRGVRVWLPASDGAVRPDEAVRPPLELVPGAVADGAPVHTRVGVAGPGRREIA